MLASRPGRTSTPAGPLRRPYRPEIMTVEERINPFPTEMSENFRTHRRAGIHSRRPCWITGSAGLMRRSDRSGTVAVEERIDPFPTGGVGYLPLHRRGRPSGGPNMRSPMTHIRAARCTAPTGVSENFRAHRRGGFVSLPRRWITESAGLLHRSYRSGTVTVEERIDPFPTGM